ncbi:FadR/GntR family transcriptional regulator [Burkholderia sp. 22PA0106]|uniref:FadR/GntR family transcriptional regulator n=1 Tax=Burkholderia sp. 22PA0106 TaxID=3237371 RepID=UPI0039C2DCDB
MSEPLHAASSTTASARASATDAILERLLDALSSGELRAGAKLPDEAQLAQSYGVPRHSLRSALIVVRDLGLVTTERGRFGGTFVAPDIRDRLHSMALERRIDAAQLRSLADWRRAVSGETCLLAARRASALQLGAIEAAAQGFVAGMLDVDLRRAADARLHLLIAEASGSRHLVEQEQAIQEAFGAVYASLPIVRHPARVACMDHSALVQALLARDGERARLAMIVHVEASYAWCCSLLRVEKLT